MRATMLRKKRAIVPVVALLVCCLGMMSQAAFATTYYVAANGSDTNNGTSPSTPFLTIQKAIDTAGSGGDTINVAAGTYHERPVIGSGKNGLTLQGTAGAIIDGSDTFTGTWALASDFSSNWCVYRTDLTGYSGEPRNIFVDDQLIATLNYAYPSYHPWYYQNIFKYGNYLAEHAPWDNCTPQGFNGIRAAAMFRSDTSPDRMYLKICPTGGNEAGIDPDTVGGTGIKWSNKETKVIAIDGSNNVTIKDLQIKYGWVGIEIKNSTGSIVEYCKILPTRNGVFLYDGCDSCIVRYNEISANAYANRSTFDLADDYWQTVKHAFVSEPYGDTVYDADFTGIRTRNNVGNHYFHDNYIHDAWDGISTGEPSQTPAQCASYDENNEVYHNYLKDMNDDALDPGHNLTNNEWHANLVVNCRLPMRFREPFYGPFYVYNNIMLEGPMMAASLIFFDNWENMEPEIYIYHNTLDEPIEPNFSGDTAPLHLNCTTADLTSTKMYNNLMYGHQYVRNKNLSSLEANHWVSDYNVFVRKGATWDSTYGQTYAQSTLGVDPNSLWSTASPGFADYANKDVSLTSSSSARNEATNLTSVFGFTPPGNLSSDCGALAYGTSMPEYYPFADTPMLSSISPAGGVTSGGTACTLSGTNLTGTSSVSFGGSAATSVSVVSDAQVRCTSPSHSAGDVSVTATTSYGTSSGVTYTYGSTPTLSSISPTSGATSGGTVCTLTGTNLTGCSAVQFAANAATNVSVLSSTSVSCSSPAGSGSVSVTATTPIGTSNGVSYTYAAGGQSYTDTLYPTADTYVQNTSSTTNFGTATTLRVQDGVTTKKRAYLKFDLSGVSGTTITSAKLRAVLEYRSATGATVKASGCSTDSWGETTLTWANMPTFGPELTSVTNCDTVGTRYEWTVTSYISSEFAGDKVATLVMHDDQLQNKDTHWRSRDYTGTDNDPQLVIVSEDAGTPAPTLSSINPNSGTTAGGTACTLSGTNLTGCSAVSFGGTAGTSIVVDSATQVRCASPAKSEGTISVTATTSGGTSNGVNYTFTTPAPTLSSIDPNSGTTAGGTACTLTGTNLTGCSAVSFGGTAGTGIVVDSATQVRCASPAKSAGTYSVTATTGSGTSNSVNYTFTTPGPTLSAINPNSGTTAGGTACTLTGTNLTGCSAVSFGGTAGTGIVVDSATQIRCTSPAKGAGTYSVTATTSGGTSNGVNFTYTTPVPALSSISPTSGTTAGGTACTLTGTDLTGCSAVSFGGTAGTGIVVDSATQVRCASPAKSAGTYSVTATTGGGTSNGVNFTYTSGGGSYTATLYPTADSYVQNTSSTSNFGTATTLRIQQGATTKRHGYMKFDLNSLSGTTVTSAKLRLVLNYRSATGATVKAFGCSTDSWTESGITYANMPAIGTELASVSNCDTVGTRYEWTVTSYINTEFAGDKTATLILHDNQLQNKDTHWRSREYSTTDDPELIVISQ